MEDVTVLDQMTQNVPALTFRGRLGFERRDETALTTASTIVVQTLEDYGHEVDQFQARQTHRISLECDHYLIDLRHRRSPAPMRKVNGVPCFSYLDLTLKPRFPEKTDEELTEMLLAQCLHRLLGKLDATTVEWLDTGVVLDRFAFLSVFASETRMISQTISADIQMPIEQDGAEPVHIGDAKTSDPVQAFDAYVARNKTAGRTTARSRFASVDETFGTLAVECDRIIERRTPAAGSQTASARSRVQGLLSRPAWSLNSASAWGLTAILALLALPFGVTAAAVNLVRGGDVRFSAQMMAIVALLMFLQSSGLGHAALR